LPALLTSSQLKRLPIRSRSPPAARRSDRAAPYRAGPCRERTPRGPRRPALPGATDDRSDAGS